MNKYLSASLNNVSMDLSSAWAAETFKEAMQLGNKYNARFQQKQMQEKEEKLLKLYENQQQRAFDRVGRGSAGSSTSLHSSGTGGGKVRQMFDERRQKAGIDKSYPLEPLRSKSNPPKSLNLDRKNVSTKTSIKSTVQNSVSVIKNGKPLVNKKEIVERLYHNDNGKESYEENRYDEDSNDNQQSKSHREIMNMMHNHTDENNIENESMPQIGFDDLDNTYKVGKLYTSGNVNNNNNDNNYHPSSKVEKKNPDVIKKSAPMTNGKSIQNKNENTTTKKNLANSKINSTLSKSITSPKNSTTKKYHPTAAMGDNKLISDARTPSSTRPSAKQSTPRAVVSRDDLNECTYCGRRFAQDRIQKHEDICSKTGKKKRKTYDATKHRVMGTELESYVLIKPSKAKASVHSSHSKVKAAVSKKDWRRTHEEFISSIRAAKEAQAHLAKGGKLSDLPPPPPSSNPDYVQCPHCGRRFNESAAERHIPKCADYQFNKPKPGSKAKIAGKK